MAEYYLDVDFVDYETDTSVSVIWTNASSTVTADADLTANIAVGDYIRSNEPTYGGTWYKVTAVSYDTATLQTSITINTSFKETTHTAGLQRNRGDGSQLTPFCHLAQFTTDTVRSPGDVLYCQSGQTLKVVFNIVIDEDGTYTDNIEIKSYDWKGIGNTSNFVVDFDGLSIYLDISYDNYWVLTDIDFTNSGTYPYRFIGSIGSKCNNISCYNNYYGPLMKYGTYEIYNFTSTNNTARGLDVVNSTVYIYDSDISYNDIGLNVQNASIIYTKNTNISSNTTYDIDFSLDYYGNSKVCIKGIDPNLVRFNSEVCNNCQAIFIEDSGSIGAQKILLPEAVIVKDESVVFSSSNIAIKYTSTGPSIFRISEWVIDNLNSGTTYTASILVKSSNLLNFPTADNLYLEVEYYDQITGTHTSVARSTEVITANDTETTLSVAFTPMQTGRARIRIMCGFDISANEVSVGTGAIYIENGFTII